MPVFECFTNTVITFVYDTSIVEISAMIVLPCIADFHIVGDWVQVCLLWDMGHNTHIAKKSTLNFTTSPSLVLIKPILDEIQPFKNSKFYYEIHTDAGQIVHRVQLSIHFLVNFLKFLNGCISFNIGPNPTKLEDFVKLSVFFLAVGVLCPISHNTQTRTQSPMI